MSSIPQKTANGNYVSSFAIKLMKRFQLGKLLVKCNAGKEKGVLVNCCLLPAAEDKNLLCSAKKYDGRSLAGRRRLQARRIPPSAQASLQSMSCSTTGFPRQRQYLH